MSKSSGNYINPAELLSGKNDIMSKAYSPSVIRFFMMQAAYRSVLDLTDTGLLASEKGFNRLMNAVDDFQNLKTSNTSSFDVKEWKKACYNAMNDDFNTPILIANLFEAVTQINAIKEGSVTITKEDLDTFKTAIHVFVFELLGLKNVQESEEGTNKLSGAVELLIKLRQEARANKDFALSDKIRDELAEVGITLNDSREGTTFSTN